jgi:hypothetical protein
MNAKAIILFIFTHGVAIFSNTFIIFIVPTIIAFFTIASSEDPGGPLFLPVLMVLSILFGLFVSGIFFIYTVLFQYIKNKYKIPIYYPAILSLPSTYIIILILGIEFPKKNSIIISIICASSVGLYLLYWSITTILPKIGLKIINKYSPKEHLTKP